MLTGGSYNTRLSKLQFNHLQQHYRTVYGFSSLTNPELLTMDQDVQVYMRCRVDKTIFHCAQNRKKNSSRLNHLACLQQTVDRNARFSYSARDEEMEFREFYMYIDFYCVHSFRGSPHMLVYGEYRNFQVHDGLVEDQGYYVHHQEKCIPAICLL